jgi:DNA-binding CsgD family transcriptional regulator
MSGKLSEQEREVLLLKANGYTSEQAAGELRMSRRVVESVITRIFTKLDVANCPQAVAMGLKLEEISMDEIKAGAP